MRSDVPVVYVVRFASARHDVTATAASASWTLAPIARSATHDRRHVRETLAAWDLDDLLDAALLLTSELVTNALLHARTDLVLRIDRSSATTVRVGVTDSSTVTPAVRRHSDTATTGRGIQLLARLADEWHTDLTDEGKTVWFVLSTGRDPWAGYSDVDWSGAGGA